MLSAENGVYFALLFLAVVVVLVTISLWRMKRVLLQQRQSQQTLQADLRALCNAAVQVGERVNRMEREQGLLQQRQQELGLRQETLAQAEPYEASFEQAIKLARKGSSVKELMDICNLSRGEAELIAMMHRLGPEQ